MGSRTDSEGADDMTDKTISQIVMQLAVAYPHKGDEIKPMLRLMADKLAKYPLPVVEQAVDEHIATSKYFPAISEMIVLCKKHHQSAGRYNAGTAEIDYKALRLDLLERTYQNGIDRREWEQMIGIAKNLGYDENVLYLETKLAQIESYSWADEKVKWTMAEMEAIAI